MATDNSATSPQVGAANQSDKNGENLLFATVFVCLRACSSVYKALCVHNAEGAHRDTIIHTT